MERPGEEVGLRGGLGKVAVMMYGWWEGHFDKGEPGYCYYPRFSFLSRNTTRYSYCRGLPISQHSGFLVKGHFQRFPFLFGYAT